MNFELKEISQYDLPFVYKDMCCQFPVEELKTYEHFLKLLSFDNYKLLYLFGSNKPLGYVLFYETIDYILVDYVAIFKEFHSKGFGSVILKSLFKRYKNKKGIFFEIEKPCCETSKRRIKFYEKLGCKKLNFNYIFPNPQGGLEMDLYYLPLGVNRFPLNEEVFEFLKKVFNEIHNDVEECCLILEKIKTLN